MLRASFLRTSCLSAGRATSTLFYAGSFGILVEILLAGYVKLVVTAIAWWSQNFAPPFFAVMLYIRSKSQLGFRSIDANILMEQDRTCSS